MEQIKTENLAGLVKNSDKEGTYTAVQKDGSRVTVDKETGRSIEKRLDKDRSEMERTGLRAPEREPERKTPHRKITDEERRAFLSQFKKTGGRE